ncbi:CU044_5270 family protein [Actinomadura citrea]|uniref:CU044_5270 family protein n=1 Tax=Actinomadura citrea TaxID=46158 RepID=UPI002E2DB43E|nr:CU044_5270 family protein [Actinomadura citrea]
MNPTPTQPNSNEHEELARLLPAPVERDLPGDRHQRLREFVMSEIDQDLRPAEQASRRSARRRPVILASAGIAAATAAAAVVVGIAGTGGAEGAKESPSLSATGSPSGRQVLLVAATTALKAPAGSGTYWHVKTIYTDRDGGARTTMESWTGRDGRVWWKGGKTQGRVVMLTRPAPFRLGGPAVTLAQLQELPATPGGLKAWIAAAVKKSDVTTSAGRPDAAAQERLVFEGLLSLVSQLPAPPQVRAAAFRAVASYPDVKDLGPVKGGQGLSISFGGGRKANLVIDPKTSRITDTDYFVSADGAQVTAPGGAEIVAEWTSAAPG